MSGLSRHKANVEIASGRVLKVRGVGTDGVLEVHIKGIEESIEQIALPGVDSGGVKIFDKVHHAIIELTGR